MRLQGRRNAPVQMERGKGFADKPNPASAQARLSITVDSSGKKFVAYRDFANGNRVTVKTLSGTKWELVGPQAFTQPIGSIGPICISPDGVLFVPYTDAINGGKISVSRTAFEP
jgi:hypothetical protein